MTNVRQHKSHTLGFRRDRLGRRAVSGLLAVFLLLVGTGSPALGQPAPTRFVVDALVQEALRSNLSLAQAKIELDRTRVALAQARGRYLPRLSLQARYSRAEGGRTINVPVGDLVNPVYRTLNDLTQSAQFPTVDDQEIPFLRPEEQETALQLRQPLFVPEIYYGAQARRHQRDAQRAAVEAVRRELVRDVRIAYYRYRQAQARVEILGAARELVNEQQRTNTRLRRVARVTQEAVYRAEVEVLAVEQQLAEAHAAVGQARRYLNVLRNRPADTPIPAPDVAPEALITQRMMALGRALGRSLEGEGERLTAATSAVADTGWAARQVAGRPELDRLASAVGAAESQRRAAQTAYLPTVSFAVDAGIQGPRYGFEGDQPFVLGSVVLRWTLFEGLSARREVEQRRLDARRLRIQREDVAQQLRLEVQDALDRVHVAQRSLATADARVTAAQESFRLVSRRYEEGRARQVEHIDARTALTEAALNHNLTRYDLLARLAHLAYAAGRPAAAQP